jgi:hypothetical protein
MKLEMKLAMNQKTVHINENSESEIWSKICQLLIVCIAWIKIKNVLIASSYTVKTSFISY